MKVFVLRMESCQDYLEQELITHYIGAFSTEKKAEGYAAKWKEVEDKDDGFYARISIFELDKP